MVTFKNPEKKKRLENRSVVIDRSPPRKATSGKGRTAQEVRDELQRKKDASLPPVVAEKKDNTDTGLQVSSSDLVAKREAGAVGSKEQLKTQLRPETTQKVARDTMTYRDALVKARFQNESARPLTTQERAVVERTMASNQGIVPVTKLAVEDLFVRQQGLRAEASSIKYSQRDIGRNIAKEGELINKARSQPVTEQEAARLQGLSTRTQEFNTRSQLFGAVLKSRSEQSTQAEKSIERSQARIKSLEQQARTATGETARRVGREIRAEQENIVSQQQNIARSSVAPISSPDRPTITIRNAKSRVPTFGLPVGKPYEVSGFSRTDTQRDLTVASTKVGGAVRSATISGGQLFKKAINQEQVNRDIERKRRELSREVMKREGLQDDTKAAKESDKRIQLLDRQIKRAEDVKAFGTGVYKFATNPRRLGKTVAAGVAIGAAIPLVSAGAAAVGVASSTAGTVLGGATKLAVVGGAAAYSVSGLQQFGSIRDRQKRAEFFGESAAEATVFGAASGPGIIAAKSFKVPQSTFDVVTNKASRQLSDLRIRGQQVSATEFNIIPSETIVSKSGESFKLPKDFSLFKQQTTSNIPNRLVGSNIPGQETASFVAGKDNQRFTQFVNIGKKRFAVTTESNPDTTLIKAARITTKDGVVSVEKIDQRKIRTPEVKQETIIEPAVEIPKQSISEFGFTQEIQKDLNIINVRRQDSKQTIQGVQRQTRRLIAQEEEPGFTRAVGRPEKLEITDKGLKFSNPATDAIEFKNTKYKFVDYEPKLAKQRVTRTSEGETIIDAPSKGIIQQTRDVEVELTLRQNRPKRIKRKLGKRGQASLRTEQEKVPTQIIEIKRPNVKPKTILEDVSIRDLLPTSKPKLGLKSLGGVATAKSSQSLTSNLSQGSFSTFNLRELSLSPRISKTFKTSNIQQFESTTLQSSVQRTDTRSRLLQKSISSPLPSSAPPTSFVPGFNIPNIPPPTTILTPPPLGGGGLKRRRGKEGKKGKRVRKLTPTTRASLFGLRGDTTKGAVFSGLGERFI